MPRLWSSTIAINAFSLVLNAGAFAAMEWWANAFAATVSGGIVVLGIAGIVDRAWPLQPEVR